MAARVGAVGDLGADYGFAVGEGGGVDGEGGVVAEDWLAGPGAGEVTVG